MQTASHNTDTGRIAHAIRPFTNRGVTYAIGDVFQLDGLSALKVGGLLAANLIAKGPPSERLLRKVALLKAGMSPPNVDALTDDELEAATAPGPKRRR